MTMSYAFPISEVNQIGEVRRKAAALTSEIGFSEQEAGALALVVTELGHNLVKYGLHGQLVLRKIDTDRKKGIEILSLDSGPGMDVHQSQRDGYSSRGTPGTGLGAVKRNSSTFEIYSAPKLGTAIVATCMAPSADSGSPIQNEVLQIGVINVAMPGESVCGDGWSVVQNPDNAVIMVVDGLGHGPIAEEAAQQAVKSFKDIVSGDICDMLAKTHNVLRSTRGAVIAAASVDLTRGDIQYAGIGNISACISDTSTSQHLVSMNGTAGLAVKIKSFDYNWPKAAILIMSSDGLTNHWKLSAYPGLAHANPSIIAGILYQNFYRGRDDVTVLVARWSQA